MGIILFNFNVDFDALNNYWRDCFRPLMGIILFNLVATNTVIPTANSRFRPLMGIILFNQTCV